MYRQGTYQIYLVISNLFIHKIYNSTLCGKRVHICSLQRYAMDGGVTKYMCADVQHVCTQTCCIVARIEQRAANITMVMIDDSKILRCCIHSALTHKSIHLHAVHTHSLAYKHKCLRANKMVKRNASGSARARDRHTTLARYLQLGADFFHVPLFITN